MARNSHSHNTRGAAKNHIQLSSANNKFASRAPKLWNDLYIYIPSENREK